MRETIWFALFCFKTGVSQVLGIWTLMYIWLISNAACHFTFYQVHLQEKTHQLNSAGLLELSLLNVYECL